MVVEAWLSEKEEISDAVVTDMLKMDENEAKQTKPSTGMGRVQENKAEGGSSPFRRCCRINLIEWLNEVSSAIKKYPEIILSVIGLSRWFVEEDVRPTFLRSNNSEMGLLDFVKSYDPFKAKVRERTLIEEDVMLSKETEDMVISPSHDAIHIVDHTLVDELKSVVGKKKRRVVFNDGLPHVKKAKGSSSVASPERNPTTAGKTSDESGSMQDKNVRFRPVSNRFVIISSSSPSVELLNTDLSASLKFASFVPYMRKEAEATAAGLAHEAGASLAPGQEA
ncbi:hypothetical protein Tco_0894939 [Tanacetum coccineum]|uniref:Uncharacterized protein n=1 Tax=Tanacetum coccineum TaxID=301880 RepID=A0ABQ5CFJ1_9ASTR